MRHPPLDLTSNTNSSPGHDFRNLHLLLTPLKTGKSLTAANAATSTQTTSVDSPVKDLLFELLTYLSPTTHRNPTFPSTHGTASKTFPDAVLAQKVVDLKASILACNKPKAAEETAPVNVPSTEKLADFTMNPKTIIGIPGYRTEHGLGAGGFGEVQLATHILTGAKVRP